MSGFPAGEVPPTSVTVCSFNFLCPNPEDSRSKESARGKAAAKPGKLHRKRGDSSVWEYLR
jgi:hypothetical protein